MATRKTLKEVLSQANTYRLFASDKFKNTPLITVDKTPKNYRVMDTTTGSIFMVKASNRRDAYTKGRQHFNRPVQVIGTFK